MPRRRTAVSCPDLSQLAVLAGWIIVLVLAARSLVAVSAPHRGDISSVTWWAHAPVDQSAVTGLCLVGLVLVTWLALTTASGLVLAVVATVGGRGVALPAWWHRCSPVVVRRIVGGVVGVGLSMAAIVPVGATPSAGTDATATSAPPVLVLLDEPTATPSEPAPPPAPTGTTATEPVAPGSAPVGAEPVGSPPPDAVVVEPGILTWTIEPGDHLWHVASATLTWARGGPADDGEVATYLDRLIAINADVVAVSGDPDVVFAGQTLVLPSLVAEGATSRSAT